MTVTALRAADSGLANALNVMINEEHAFAEASRMVRA
jgi:hypothetical protein